MAASLPPTTSSTPATPSDSNPELGSKASMAPSTIVTNAASPDKSGAQPAPKGNVVDEGEATAEKPPASKSKSKRRRDRNPKPKPKPKRDKAQCVGYYVDALDKKMLWGEARIIQCNLTTQKIKVHFVGWSKTYDLWTDPMSITAHGRYTTRTCGSKDKSWDGDMHMFEDMLGTIEQATFTPIPVPAESQPHITPPSSSAKKKTSNKKRMPSEQKTKPSTARTEPEPRRERPEPEPRREGSTTRPEPENRRERLHSKRKVVVKTQEKTASSARATVNATERSRPRQESVRSSKRAAPEVKKTNDSTEEKEKLLRSSKRQKREEKQATTMAAPPKPSRVRPSKKKKILSPRQLPLFRDLEMDDGTVLDFSAQREKAQGERDALKSFIDSCALIWKKQLALSVQ